MSREEAKAYARRMIQEKGGVVVKPDGLSGGKGVVVAHTVEEAWRAIDAIWDADK